MSLFPASTPSGSVRSTSGTCVDEVRPEGRVGRGKGQEHPNCYILGHLKTKFSARLDLHAASRCESAAMDITTIGYD